MSAWVTACLLVAALQPCAAMHVMRAPGTVPNFRDLGFTPCADGRVIKPGVLLRSATPANISEADADYVLSQVWNACVHVVALRALRGSWCVSVVRDAQ